MSIRSSLSTAGLTAGALLLFAVRGLQAGPAPSENERLVATARLWGTVKYFHPYLAYRDIDWDKALVQALPAIRSATDSEAYGRALNTMLQALGDQASQVGSNVGAVVSTPLTPQRTWVHSGTESWFAVQSRMPEIVTIPMGGGIKALVRLSEPVASALPPVPRPLRDATYSQLGYPAVEYRILAAFKLWITVRDFFAYRDLMDGDWDEDFSAFLPKFIDAKNMREYNLAVAEAVTLLDDSNAQIRSADLNDFFGISPVGLRIRLVEKKPVVTEILDEAAAQAGVEVGDVVTRVDDEEIVHRIQRLIQYIPGSTDQSLAAQVSRIVLNGPAGSDAALLLQGRDGAEKKATLTRSDKYLGPLSIERTGEPMKFLSRAIGYVDLERLRPEQIDSVFDRFSSTTALVLDARGSLHFDPELFASRFVQTDDIATAIVTGPVTAVPDLHSEAALTQTSSFFRVETLPPSQKPLYKGKTVMLIDERTCGAAEHLGLLLEAANKTIFVGSLSTGADGDVMSLALPGGITVSFSITDVRHGNGGKLQRVGLQPLESISPTVSAIRAKRDAVLEKALDVAVAP